MNFNVCAYIFSIIHIRIQPRPIWKYQGTSWLKSSCHISQCNPGVSDYPDFFSTVKKVWKIYEITSSKVALLVQQVFMNTWILMYVIISF